MHNSNNYPWSLNISYAKVLEQLIHDYLLSENDFINLYRFMEGGLNNDVTFSIARIKNKQTQIDVSIKYGRSKNTETYMKAKRTMEEHLLERMRNIISEWNCIIPYHPFKRFT